MKFQYEYRTSDNIRHSDVVTASDREAAFKLLRERGIKPARLIEAPGVFNLLFGKGKRWIAIFGLACALLGALLYLAREASAEHYAAEERSQVFGDPSLMQKLARNGWRDSFPDEGEAWMARHAIPGHDCGCVSNSPNDEVVMMALQARRQRPVRISESDPDELKKMKRIVNGTKQELNAFVDSPADIYEYMRRACERVRIEHKIYENMARDISTIERKMGVDAENRMQLVEQWDKKNATLRSMGLPTIPLPEAKFPLDEE